MPDCLEFIGGNCRKPNAHAEDFACAAVLNQACKQGYRDELLQANYGTDYARFKQEYKNARNTAWKNAVRARMRNKLNAKEKVLADLWIANGGASAKLNHNIWLKAKAGIQPNETAQDRLLRRQNNFRTLLSTNPNNLKAKEGLARITAVIDRMGGEVIGEAPGAGFGLIASNTPQTSTSEEITQRINRDKGRITEIETRLQTINDEIRSFNGEEMKQGHLDGLNAEKRRLEREKHNLESVQLPQLRNLLQDAPELEWWESDGKRGQRPAGTVAIIDGNEMTGRWKNNEEEEEEEEEEEDFIFGSFTNEQRARMRQGGKRTRKHRKHKKKRKKKRKTKRKAIRKAKRKTKNDKLIF